MSSSGKRGPVDEKRAAEAIEAFLGALGLDTTAGELVGTGARVAECFAEELCAGYGVDAAALLTESAMPAHTGLVTLRGLDVAVTCPHHLMPAVGTCDVAFAPVERLVGLGAIERVVRVLGQRLVLQETLGEDVVRAIDQALAPRFVACRLVLRHGCMTARGERSHGARVVTFAVRGAIDVKDAVALFPPVGA